MNDVDGELNLGVRLAPLTDEIQWLPAVENRGEGIFIAFKKEEIAGWRQRGELPKRESSCLKASNYGARSILDRQHSSPGLRT
jgi:hypothetical protein